MSDATSSTPSSVHDDLAFLRSLVDEDWRPGVWSFGAYYMAVGVVLIVHMAVSGLLAGYQELIGYVVLYSVFTVVTFAIGARSRRLFGTSVTPQNVQSGGVKGRAGASALAGAFLAHLALLIAFVIAAARNDAPAMMELTPLALFVLQGVVWIVIHAIRRERWHMLEAWAWILAAIGCAPLVGTPWLGVAVAGVAFALMVAPGAYMMRSARRAD